MSKLEQRGLSRRMELAENPAPAQTRCDSCGKEEGGVRAERMLRRLQQERLAVGIRRMRQP